MNTPDMSKEQARELAELRRRLAGQNKQRKTIERDAQKDGKRAASPAEHAKLKRACKAAETALKEWEKRAAREEVRINKAAVKQLKGLDKASGEIERRMDILLGRISS